MSFSDDVRDVKRRPTHLVFRCQLCDRDYLEPHDDPEVALRRAVETNDLVRVHQCSNGVHGCCRLVGTGPARPFAWRTESPPEGRIGAERKE